MQIPQSFNLYLALAHDTNTVDKWSKKMHRVATPLLWTACVQNHALYAYLRDYGHFRALAVPPRPPAVRHGDAIYARNVAAAFQLRLHLVHILVNVAQVVSSALGQRVRPAHSSPRVVPIYPRRLAPWHLAPCGAAPAPGLIGELQPAERATLRKAGIALPTHSSPMAPGTRPATAAPHGALPEPHGALPEPHGALPEPHGALPEQRARAARVRVNRNPR